MRRFRSLLVVLCLLAGHAAAASEKVWLSDLDLSKMSQPWTTKSWSPLKDQSLAGRPLCVGGKTFGRGLGTCFYSWGEIDLKGSCTRFSAMVGVDDASLDNRPGDAGFIEFVVFVDNKAVWKSGPMKKGDAAKKILVDLTGGKTLYIQVNDRGKDGKHWGGDCFADWCDGFIEFERQRPETFLTRWSPRVKPQMTLEVWPAKPPLPQGQEDKGEVEEKLWDRPDGDPATRWLVGVARSSLLVYRPEKDKDTGAAVIVCPGGCYGFLAIDNEGEEVAQWLSSVGVTGIILKYRLIYGREGAWQDGQRAVSLVRSHAQQWKIAPHRIGILGFSAGGHLAAVVAAKGTERFYKPIDAVDNISCRPDFAAPIYPAVGEEKLAADGSLTIWPPRRRSSSLLPITTAFATEASRSSRPSARPKCRWSCTFIRPEAMDSASAATILVPSGIRASWNG